MNETKSQYPIFLCTEPLRFLKVQKRNIMNWEMFLEECGKLPLIPVDESKILNSLVITIYGPPKVGKSTLASLFQETPTIVIDTIDNLVTFGTDFICKREDIDHPTDLKYGKGWDVVTYEIIRVLTKLSMMGYCLIFIGHSKISEIETKTKKFNKAILSAKGGEIRNKILSMSNIIMYIEPSIKGDDEIGMIRTKTSIYHDAGDQSNMLPGTIEYPLDNPRIAYDIIQKAFSDGAVK